MAHTSDLIAEDIAEYLHQHQHKDLLRFIACGSVDDGKSTLIGRLLYESHLVFEDHLAALEADSKRVGTQGGDLDFALLLDGLTALGPSAVLLKGGHLDGAESVDLLLADGAVERLAAPRHATSNTHGTGCTLSSAIAAELAKDGDLVRAAGTAHGYLQEAIRRADDLSIGGGHGPVHHFHEFWPA